MTRRVEEGFTHGSQNDAAGVSYACNAAACYSAASRGWAMLVQTS
jgi:hypothetical protein